MNSSLNGGSRPGISLLDCVPAPVMVPITINGIESEIACYGVGIGDLAALLGRFPDLMALLMPAEDDKPQSWDARSLLQASPAALACILAAGTGHASEEPYEAAAARLPAEVQVDMLTAIISQTMPQGFGPFVRRLTLALNIVVSAETQAEEAVPLSGVELVTKLLSQSKD